MKKMTQQEYLEKWNRENPMKYATLDQIVVCGCGNKNCCGWFCEAKTDHKVKSRFV